MAAAEERKTLRVTLRESESSVRPDSNIAVPEPARVPGRLFLPGLFKPTRIRLGRHRKQKWTLWSPRRQNCLPLGDGLAAEVGAGIHLSPAFERVHEMRGRYLPPRNRKTSSISRMITTANSSRNPRDCWNWSIMKPYRSCAVRSLSRTNSWYSTTPILAAQSL